MQIWVWNLQLPPVLLLCPCIQGFQLKNKMFLNNQQVTEEIKREIKKFLEKKMAMKTQQLKTYGMQQKQF